MSSRLLFRTCIIAILLAPGVLAADVSRFFGHEIAITGENPERSLEIDGRSVLKDAIISISEVTVIGGVPTLVGERSAGGNACDASPFIISFPQSGQPRIDGPIDSCAYVPREIKRDSILFSTPAVPGSDGERWSWTPADGLKKSTSVAFKADAAKGWATLRERTLEHPADVFSFSEIADQLSSLLGADRSAFEDIITGVGGGEFRGDNYIGIACTRHMCDSTGAIVFLSTADRKVYVAWKPDGEKIVVRPPVKEWPDEPRQALKTWAAKWK